MCCTFVQWTVEENNFSIHEAAGDDCEFIALRLDYSNMSFHYMNINCTSLHLQIERVVLRLRYKGTQCHSHSSLCQRRAEDGKKKREKWRGKVICATMAQKAMYPCCYGLGWKVAVSNSTLSWCHNPCSRKKRQREWEWYSGSDEGKGTQQSYGGIQLLNPMCWNLLFFY